MNDIVSGNTVVLINMCLYIGLFICCWYRHRWHNMSTFLSLLYAFSAISAYLLYNSPLYHFTYKKVQEPTIDGCLCLFIINAALILTFSYFNLSKYRCVLNHNPYWLKQCQKWITVLLLVYVIFSLPASVSDFFMSTDLARMRNAVYGTHNESSLFFVSLIKRTVGSMPFVILTIAFINIFLFRKKDTWDKLSVFVYVLINLDTMFSAVSRSTIVFSMIEFIIILITFSAFFSKRTKREILTCTLLIFSFLSVVFVAISSDRFGDIRKATRPVVFSTLRYSGETQLNFMTWLYPDLKHPLYGYKQFSLFRRVLGQDYSDGLDRKGTSVYNSYVKKTYKYSHPFYMFYGVAGDYVLNWGCIVTMILAVSVSVSFRRYHKRNEPGISAANIILSIVLAAYYAKGIFYSDYQFESGNLLIVFLLIMYLYLRDTGIPYLIYNRNLHKYYTKDTAGTL